MLCCVVLLCSVVLCCAVLCCVVLCIVLCCVVLCCVVLCCAVLCSVVTITSAVLAGGTTLLPGLSDRLERDYKRLRAFYSKPGTSIEACKVLAPPNRQHSVWAGASLLANAFKDLQKVWLSKAAYEELGAEAAIPQTVWA